MSTQDLSYFSELKKAVAKKLLETYAVDSDIQNWKGDAILNFQDDLSDKVNGRISEKWFYTHIKGDNEKLPRIDMLNMLAEYAGYQNWIHFKNETALPDIKTESGKRSKKKPILWLLVGALFLFTCFMIFQFTDRRETYQFCFIDADHKSSIQGTPIYVTLINDNESPMIARCDSNGCISISTAEDKIRLVIQSPYYKTDTITRIVYNKNIKEEIVELKTNDYAMMIHLFSKSKVKDWKKRRVQLDDMIAENARIYQVSESESSVMELYNKKEFINKLTMPIKSLKNIEVIETIYSGDRIAVLRFKQIEEEVAHE